MDEPEKAPTIDSLGRVNNGRTPKKIDADTVRALASVFCTMKQIALICKCSVDTLERRFADVIKEGRAQAQQSLLKKQFDVAMNGNVSMLIWLGKQHLEQSEKVEQHIGVLPTATQITFMDEKEKLVLGAKLIESEDKDAVKKG